MAKQKLQTKQIPDVAMKSIRELQKEAQDAQQRYNIFIQGVAAGQGCGEGYRFDMESASFLPVEES